MGFFRKEFEKKGGDNRFIHTLERRSMADKELWPHRIRYSRLKIFVVLNSFMVIRYYLANYYRQFRYSTRQRGFLGKWIESGQSRQYGG